MMIAISRHELANCRERWCLVGHHDHVVFGSTPLAVHSEIKTLSACLEKVGFVVGSTDTSGVV